MTVVDRTVSDARADALKWQAQASSRPPEPMNTEDTDRERARAPGMPRRRHRRCPAGGDRLAGGATG
jgi:hypothetical protein